MSAPLRVGDVLVGFRNTAGQPEFALVNPDHLNRIQGEQRMSVRVHTTTASNVAVRVLDNPEVNDLFGFDESPLPQGKSLVIEDGGNMEAWVIVASDDEMFTFAKTVRHAAFGGDDKGGYCDPADVDTIRLRREEDRFEVDGEDHLFRYTEDCRSLDTFEEAIGVIAEFIETNGIFPPEPEQPVAPAPIATAAELRAALDGLDDATVALQDGSVYIGPGSRATDPS